ncbi:damage-inducible protein DinB [Paenibacillus rhizovicinus]|uniref:Damage-inducible protein DinB n=1 Tax=Paenibacillus rhizovicinus TaxID=2704463 RepID=A0A6C0P8M6_9BACL|nr:DinB family protein [Paenibacillus rhizovicinus]QHW33983.1 damage-inducible protein DinB [Paenibacillus rhizovicinus]
MTTINEFIGEWLSHRKVLHQMLEDVTTEQLQLKPWEKAMTLSGLILHITGAMGMFANTVKNGVYTQAVPPKAFTTIDELRANIAADTEETEAILRSIAPEQLEQSIDFFGHAMTGSALLQNAKDHEIHHKGQLFIYLRLAGIEKLPFFVYRG